MSTSYYISTYVNIKYDKFKSYYLSKSGKYCPSLLWNYNIFSKPHDFEAMRPAVPVKLVYNVTDPQRVSVFISDY